MINIIFPVEKKLGVFMSMEIVKREKHLCPYCMEDHEIKKVLINDEATFKI